MHGTKVRWRFESRMPVIGGQCDLTVMDCWIDGKTIVSEYWYSGSRILFLTRITNGSKTIHCTGTKSFEFDNCVAPFISWRRPAHLAPFSIFGSVREEKDRYSCVILSHFSPFEPEWLTVMPLSSIISIPAHAFGNKTPKLHGSL